MHLVSRAVLVLGAAAIIASCGKVAPALESGSRCSLNSDCKSPLVCNFERCRAECLTSRDCNGQLCVRGEGSSVCQLSDETECTHDSQCVGTQVCGIDRRCRDICATDKDCVAELICAAGVCARPDELVNGKLRARVPSDAGASCTYASDCPPELVCLNGRCDIECLGDKDCVVGWTCQTLASGGDGRCYPNRQARDASSDVGDAADAADAADASDAAPPQALPSALAAGSAFSCVLFAGGKVKCWGSNFFGQLGLGNTANRGDGPGEMGDTLPYLDLGTGRTATAIATGRDHACALLDNGRVKCWGSNGNGQLGLGDLSNRGDGPAEMGDALPYVDLGAGRTATTVATGRFHTCAILDNGRVKCWGYGAFGQLGLGSTDTRGGGPGEMGDTLPFVDLGTGRTAKKLVAGNYDFTCAILDNDRLKCWGQNSGGELGLGDAQPRGDDAGEMGDALPFVDLGAGRTVKAVAAGTFHACAVLDNNRVKCWGYNTSGELGLGDTATRGTGAGEMGDALPYVDLGTGRTATVITTGDRNTCAILDNQRVACWGAGSVGELGVGSTGTRGDGPGEMGNALLLADLGTGRLAKAMAINYSFGCAILDNDRVKCWGLNTFGQLGLGDTQNRGDNPGEVGDALPYLKLVGP